MLLSKASNEGAQLLEGFNWAELIKCVLVVVIHISPISVESAVSLINRRP